MTNQGSPSIKDGSKSQYVTNAELSDGSSPFDFTRAPDLAMLKRVMVGHGYSREALIKTGGLPSRDVRIDVDGMLARTSEPTPFNVLARLFLLAREVSTDDAGKAIAPLGVDALIDFGLLRAGSTLGTVRAICAIVTFGDVLILRDFEPHVTGASLKCDHVLGVGVSTILLANLTVRFGNERLLDIGTGQGFHALVASDHARAVVATDVNARALCFARTGGLMNECEHIDWRNGSLFEPVANEELFDVIVCNPPFVIAPPHDTVAIGGRHHGDDLCRTLIQSASKHLAKGGYATILFNWHHTTDEDWRERPKQWLEGVDADAFIIRFRTSSVEEYANGWLNESGQASSDLQAQGSAGNTSPLKDWLAYYTSIGAKRISLGVCIQRVRSQNQWPVISPMRRFDHYSLDSLEDAAGNQIQRLFYGEALRQLAARDADALLDAPITVTRDLEVDQQLTLTPEHAWGMKQATLKQTTGFPMLIGIDAVVMQFLTLCDGSRTLREITAELAKRFNAPLDQVVAQSTQLTQRLLSMGYVEEWPKRS